MYKVIKHLTDRISVSFNYRREVLRIEQDVKLDYKDVLIRPKRSTLSSRKQVQLDRGFNFRNYTPYVATDVLPDGYPSGPSNMHITAVCPLWQVTWTALVHLIWQINLLKAISLLVLVKTYQ